MTTPKLDEQAIFNVARQIEAPEARRLYLEQSCGADAELHARVEALLRVYEEEQSFLQSAAEGLRATIDGPALNEGPGTVIGPYKLLQQIGEGGMGTVFMAEQQQPLRRKVALKVIKAGMDSRQVIARFEAERQALAMMDHVNIARVFDAGATASTRPYFVMELVHGVPITTYCDDNHLTPRERLELFVPVCQAVQHAHQKGVIHRDLKPSNVLVALYDGRPVPKVIDFGVAKAAGQPLTDRTLFTGFGAVVGTLEYMSPEQAQLNQLDIDTRADVYSLGILLYELLTGTTPLERKRLKDMGLLEALRLIREEETPRPSARVSTTEELPAVAANRGLEPKRLMTAIRGEPDWIVMKALEKDRDRRYDSAGGLARDIGRYLADEPVQACPPSALYRFRKFTRRRKGAFAAMLAAALVVLLGVVGMAVSNVLIARERDAKNEYLKQKEDALQQTRREKEQRERNLARAEANFQAALGAVDQMLRALGDDKELKEMSKGGDAGSAPMDKARFEVLVKARHAQLEKARQIFQGFVDKNAGNPETRLERAWAFARLGKLYSMQEGRYAEAAEADYQAIALFEQLAAESPGEPNRRRELAEGCSALVGPLRYLRFRVQSALLAGQAVSSLTTPGLPAATTQLLATTRRLTIDRQWPELPFSEEAQARARAIGLYEGLATEFPGDPQYRLALADQYEAQGNDCGNARGITAQRLQGYRRSAAVCTRLTQDFPGNRDYRLRLVKTCTGALNYGGSPPVEAEEFLRLLARVRKKLVEDFNVQEDVVGLAGAHLLLGKYLQRNGRNREAEEAYRQALAVYDALPPHAIPYGHRAPSGGLDSVCNRLGHLLQNAGRLPEAEKIFRRSVDFYESLPAKDREIDTSDALNAGRIGPTWYEQAGESRAEAVHFDYWSLGQILKNAGRFPEAEQVYRRIVALDEKLAALWEKRMPGPLHPRGAYPRYRLGLAGDRVVLGEVLKAVGRPKQAERAYRQAADLYQKLADEYPTVAASGRGQAAKTWTSLGKMWKDARQPDKAGWAYRQAAEAYRQAVDRSFADLAFRERSSRAWEDETPQVVAALGLMASAAGAPAFPQVAFVLEWAALDADAVPVGPREWGALANIGVDLGRRLLDLGKRAEAREVLRKALPVVEKAVADNPGDHNRMWLAWCHRDLLGPLLQEKGDQKGAEAEFRRAIELDPKDAIAQTNLGLALGAQGKLDVAIACYRKAIELDPKSQRAHYELAWQLTVCSDLKLREPKQALVSARLAVQLDSKNGMCWQGLGYAEYRSGNWQAAVLAFQKVKELGSPGDSLEWFPLSMAYWQLGDKDAARKTYDQAVQWMEKNNPKSGFLRGLQAEAAELMGIKLKKK